MAIWDRLVEFAAERNGYVTTRDAREIGVDPVQLRLLLARGRLERAGRGVYRVSLLPRGQHDELAAAVAWTLGRGVISHESALALHALADVNPSRIHLTVPRENHPRAAGGELYRLHRRELPAADITSVDAIPVTTVARTITDCLKAGADPYQLRVAIQRAEAEGTLRRGPAEKLRQAIDHRVTESAARIKENRCDPTIFNTADKPAFIARSTCSCGATAGSCIRSPPTAHCDDRRRATGFSAIWAATARCGSVHAVENIEAACTVPASAMRRRAERSHHGSGCYIGLLLTAAAASRFITRCDQRVIVGTDDRQR